MIPKAIIETIALPDGREITLETGKLAKQANVSVETIRYYQQIGLFEEPNKPLQGFRSYSDQNIQELKFIRKAQKLGFTLTEIQELL